MSHSATNGDWDRWSEQWRAERVPETELAALVARTARARRALIGMRVLTLAVTLLALAAVAAALYHASNALERALGVVVAIGICIAWGVDTAQQRDIHAHADAPPEKYLALRRALCMRWLRFARLLWVLSALDLIFLFPWWVGGARYHGFGFRFVHLTSPWGPLGLIVVAVVAAARIHRKASAELKSIDQTSDNG